jgi:hypothetical protein
MVTDKMTIDDTYIQLQPGVVTELPANKHFMFGVVNLRTGVTYSMKYWREQTEYSANS